MSTLCAILIILYSLLMHKIISLQLSCFVGFAVGSLVGGFLYRLIGGALSFKLYSYFALFCSGLHFFLFIQFFSHKTTAVPKGLNIILFCIFVNIIQFVAINSVICFCFSCLFSEV